MSTIVAPPESSPSGGSFDPTTHSSDGSAARISGPLNRVLVVVVVATVSCGEVTRSLDVFLGKSQNSSPEAATALPPEGARTSVLDCPSLPKLCGFFSGDTTGVNGGLLSTELPPLVVRGTTTLKAGLGLHSARSPRSGVDTLVDRLIPGRPSTFFLSRFRAAIYIAALAGRRSVLRDP